RAAAARHRCAHFTDELLAHAAGVVIDPRGVTLDRHPWPWFGGRVVLADRKIRARSDVPEQRDPVGAERGRRRLDRVGLLGSDQRRGKCGHRGQRTRRREDRESAHTHLLTAGYYAAPLHVAYAGDCAKITPEEGAPDDAIVAGGGVGGRGVRNGDLDSWRQ